MRIGIMLRTLDEKGGVAVYSQNILESLLRLDSPHQFVLFYRRPVHLGRYGQLPGVTERVVRGRSKAYWDQVAIPLASRRERLDILFHPKFTVPFLAPCPAVMVVHGADWFMPEQARFYPWLDVRYVRLIMPLYFRRAARVISVSRLTTENFHRVLSLPPGKIQTIYFGPAPHFQRVVDDTRLAAVRERYQLPPHFILTLTKLKGDRRKNFGQIVASYRQYHATAAAPLPLVVGGHDAGQLRAIYAIPDVGYGQDVLFPGWLEQADLPAVYSLADAFLYPSNLEAFPIPVTEAMACGTPLITSSVNGLEEIAGDAALYVDPGDATAIAASLAQVLGDAGLRASLSRRGLARAKMFSWDRCARETLAVLVQAAGDRVRRRQAHTPEDSA